MESNAIGHDEILKKGEKNMKEKASYKPEEIVEATRLRRDLEHHLSLVNSWWVDMKRNSYKINRSIKTAAELTIKGLKEAYNSFNNLPNNIKSVFLRENALLEDDNVLTEINDLSKALRGTNPNGLSKKRNYQGQL